MDLSIIIAHYDPGNHPKHLNSFHKTLSIIQKEPLKKSIEIIIADDGSVPNKDIQFSTKTTINQNGMEIYCLSDNQLDTWKEKRGFNYSNIKHWLYLPKTRPLMAKARIANAAILKAKSKKLLFLDDDNYFISKNSITSIINLLENFQLVIGQVQDKNGHLRSFSSNRVQGTTFGIEKNTIINAGLFGEWTEEISCAVDSDIWWKLYHYFQKFPKLKACYSSEIKTLDSCSKRWKPHIKQFFRHRAARKLFHKIHGCPNYRDVNKNPSRAKSNWLVDLT